MRPFRALLVAVALSVPAGLSAQEPYHAPQRVNVRTGPGTEYGIRNTLRVGQEVLLGVTDAAGWAPVVTPGGDPLGYVLARLMSRGPRPESLAPQSPPAQRFGWITGCENGSLEVPSVNVWRDRDRVGSRVVAQLPGTSSSNRCRGARVEIIDEGPGRMGQLRYRVRTAQGVTGWVTHFFVILESSDPA